VGVFSLPFIASRQGRGKLTFYEAVIFPGQGIKPKRVMIIGDFGFILERENVSDHIGQVR
jgi:hypothetical protein